MPCTRGAVPGWPPSGCSDGERVPTHCPYCALQCAQSLTPTDDGVEVAGRDFPTNRGGLCKKGWTSASVLRAPDRLTPPSSATPTRELRPASWDEALDLVAVRLAAVREEHGADAVAVFGGGGLTNEKAYQARQVRPRRTRHRQHRLQRPFCMSSAAAAANRSSASTAGCRSR